VLQTLPSNWILVGIPPGAATLRKEPKTLNLAFYREIGNYITTEKTPQHGFAASSKDKEGSGIAEPLISHYSTNS
jgi:hypothetical protein